MASCTICRLFFSEPFYGESRPLVSRQVHFRRRRDHGDGDLELPEPDPERAHGLKYSLFYGTRTERLVGYDNERGKGDHRHYRDLEEPYLFESPEKLISDFLSDVARIRRET
jgi:hypothetical protein